MVTVLLMKGLHAVSSRESQATPELAI